MSMDKVKEWADRSESDAGYQILSPEETADQVVSGNQDSSSKDKKETITKKLPKLSLVHDSVDTLLQYLDATDDKEAKSYYEHLRVLHEIIIRQHVSRWEAIHTGLVFQTSQHCRTSTYLTQPSSPHPGTSSALMEPVSSTDSD